MYFSGGPTLPIAAQTSPGTFVWQHRGKHSCQSTAVTDVGKIAQGVEMAPYHKTRCLLCLLESFGSIDKGRSTELLESRPPYLISLWARLLRPLFLQLPHGHIFKLLPTQNG